MASAPYGGGAVEASVAPSTSTSPCRAPIPRVALDEADDVALAEPSEITDAGGADLMQEQTNEWQRTQDGCRRQAAFPARVVAEPFALRRGRHGA